MMRVIPTLLLMSTLLISFNEVLGQATGSGIVLKYQKPVILNKKSKNTLEPKDSGKVDPVVLVPPIWGRSIRQAGFDLPLPFGMGFNFMVMNRTNTISDLVVSAQGIQIPFDVEFRNTRSTDLNATVRLDMWVFPFFNVYGIAGYTTGRVNPDILVPAMTIEVPFIGEIEIQNPIIINEELHYFGSTFGYGMTLAGGYKSIFGSLDFNHTWTDLSIAPEALETFVFSPRFGLLLDLGGRKGYGTIWVGMMGIYFSQVVQGTVPVADVDPGLVPVVGEVFHYNLELSSEKPWNFIVGGSWMLGRKMSLMMEAGAGDRLQFLTGFFFRL